MRYVLPVAVAAVFLVGAGSAMAETRDFDVAEFDAVSVTSGIDVGVARGDRRAVRAESDNGDILDKLEIEVRNGRLEIAVDRSLLDFIFDGGIGEWLAGGPKVTVYVTTPELNELEAHSGSRAAADLLHGRNLSVEASSGAQVDIGNVEGDFLAADSSSGATVIVAGTCGRLEAGASSGGNLKLEQLACGDVRAEASSGAHAAVRATRSIEANASSGGNIDVWGKPDDIEVDTSSGGHVDFRGG